MEPGEFYFGPTMVPVTTQPGWFAKFLGAKPVNEFTIVQTIVMACPYCSTPIMTTSGHKIEHRAPLTIAREITCPWLYGSARFTEVAARQSANELLRLEYLTARSHAGHGQQKAEQPHAVRLASGPGRF